MVYITGSSGYIATGLKEYLQNSELGGQIKMLGRSDHADYRLDLTKPEEFFYDVFAEGDIVLHTAAVSSPDRCAKEYRSSYQINVEGTAYFIKEVLKRGSRVIFFSSDAVFGTNTKTIFTENSPMCGDTAYGQMKKEIEETFSDEVQFKSIRLSYVVSTRDKFTQYCLQCAREGREAEVFHPLYRSCIILKDLCKTVFWLVEHFNSFEPHNLNIAGDELVSRVRIADELNRIFANGLCYSIKYPGDDFYTYRPNTSEMKSLYLYNLGIIERGTFSEKMSEEMKDIRI